MHIMQILTTVLTALLATAFAATIPNTGDGANAAGGIQIDCYKKCNDYYNNCMTVRASTFLPRSLLLYNLRIARTRADIAAAHRAASSASPASTSANMLPAV